MNEWLWILRWQSWGQVHKSHVMFYVDYKQFLIGWCHVDLMTYWMQLTARGAFGVDTKNSMLLTEESRCFSLRRTINQLSGQCTNYISITTCQYSLCQQHGDIDIWHWWAGKQLLYSLACQSQLICLGMDQYISFWNYICPTKVLNH